MSRMVALTTHDNPYDPFDDFKKWFMYDNDHGYCSCGYLARIARTSDALTPEENDQMIEEAIDDIIRLDFEGIYEKRVKETATNEPEYYMEQAN